jgi:hypothetical protein
MANWNDLLNNMSRIALSYTQGITNPVTPAIATISNVSKINIPQVSRYVSTISRPLVSGVSSIGSLSKINIPQTLQRSIPTTSLSIPAGLGMSVVKSVASPLAIGTINISKPALSRINKISNLPRLDIQKSVEIASQIPRNAIMVPGGLAIGAAGSLVSPLIRGEKFIYYEPRTARISTTPPPTFSGLNTTNITNSTVNATALRTQDVLPSISTIPPPIYKPRGDFMSWGTNKWGTATMVGTGKYKNTRVNNQVDYGTLYKTDKGAWYLVTPNGQVIQSGGAGSLSAMPKLQLRKQKYNRTKKSNKKSCGKPNCKSKIKTTKRRGVRK